MTDAAHRYRELVAGSAHGPALMLDEPLSLWGGLDAETGMIVDRHHPQFGDCVAGAVVFMAHGRGSSSASSVLAEAIRLGTAPVAFVLDEADEILVLGALVGHELYDVITPVLVRTPEAPHATMTGQTVTIGAGTVVIT